MSSQAISSKETPIIDEEEIFKTLSHRIRRNIIKVVGNEGKLSFSEILNRLESIDSPTLSYHLKSMQSLLKQEKNKYSLSEIGDASLFLLTKTDQSIKISKYRRNFLYAYIVTVACWLAAMTIIPPILGSSISMTAYIGYSIAINVIAVMNWIVLWQLRKRYT